MGCQNTLYFRTIPARSSVLSSHILPHIHKTQLSYHSACTCRTIRGRRPALPLISINLVPATVGYRCVSSDQISQQHGMKKRMLVSQAEQNGLGDKAASLKLPVGFLGGDKGPQVIALDIGGTLTKLAYCPASSPPGDRMDKELPRLICQVFRTSDIEECFIHVGELISELSKTLSLRPIRIVTTGGGALKYAERMKQLWGSLEDLSTSKGNLVASRHSEDEMACLGFGLHFLQDHIPDELFTFDSTGLVPCTGPVPSTEARITRRQSFRPQRYFLPDRPLLLTNIGSGVTFLLCPSHFAPPSSTDSPPLNAKGRNQMQHPFRVGGTPLGGSTLFALLKLLTGTDDFGKLLELAAHGDSRNVDITVGDIYGSDYSNIGLSGDRVAGILGGVAVGKRGASGQEAGATASEQGHSKADLARSLVFGISYNIGQMAVLQARLNNTAPEICFAGNFIGDNELILGAIDYAVKVNSNREFSATFMKHEGLLGAIGAWVRGTQMDS